MTRARTALRILHGGWLVMLVRLAPRRALGFLAPEDPLYARAGEVFAERALRARGWRFLARRFPTRWGEIDLLFADGPILVVLEVKTGRIGPRYRPGQRFGREALARRWRAARSLAHGPACRVDLIEVVLDAKRKPTLVHHESLRSPL